MLKIRLSRTGKKSQPSFRIIVQEHTAPIKGKFAEIVGHYVPSTTPKVFEVKEDRIKYWISVGAQPSDTVACLLKKAGFADMDKYIDPRNKKRKKKKEQPEKPAAPAEEPKKEEAPAAPKVEEPKAEAPVAEEKPKEEEKPAEAAPVGEAPKEESKEEKPAEEKEEAPEKEEAKEEKPAEEPKK